MAPSLLESTTAIVERGIETRGGLEATDGLGGRKDVPFTIAHPPAGPGAAVNFAGFRSAEGPEEPGDGAGEEQRIDEVEKPAHAPEAPARVFRPQVAFDE